MRRFAAFCLDEKAVDDYRASRGFKTMPYCDSCHRAMSLRSDQPGNFRCNSCGKCQNGYANTAFEDCRKGKGSFLYVAKLWVAGLKARQLVELGEVDGKTVQAWTKLFRYAVSWDLKRDQDAMMIGGPDIIVEIDESKFGERKYNKGHRGEGSWFVGAVERTPERRLVAEVVPNRTAKNLLAFIDKYVAHGSIVQTDCWKGFKKDGLLDRGMLHGTVNHSKHFVDPATLVHTNTIEGTWSGIKQKVASRHYAEHLLPEYLDEFIWRRNHEGNIWEDFLVALRDVYDQKL